MGVGGQSLLVKWGRWVGSLCEIRRWVRRGGTGHTAGEGGHPSINRVSGSSLPDIGPVYVGCLILNHGFIWLMGRVFWLVSPLGALNPFFESL